MAPIREGGQQCLHRLPSSAADIDSSTAPTPTKHKGFRLDLGKGLREDFAGRRGIYMSDWTDGVAKKTIPAVLFLYFACILPAVAFGGIATQVTGGALGVIEYLIACGTGGMAFSIFSGQPMTFIGPTGLTLAFITALSGFTSVMALPFLPMYAWVGVWTSFFLCTLSMLNACDLVKYATQFTDDVFNALLAVNFIYEALRSLLRNFSASGTDKSGAFMALNIAAVTYSATRKATAARDSSYFTNRLREIISDFGPVLVIVAMTAVCRIPSFAALGLDFLEVPTRFMLANSRPWLVDMASVPMKLRWLSALPAGLLTTLFFLDQNISARVVNSPKNRMTKPPAYHIDILVLGVITFFLSIFGLPWQCAATVQSLNHVRAMTVTRREVVEPPPTQAAAQATTQAQAVDKAVTVGDSDSQQQQQQQQQVAETGAKESSSSEAAATADGKMETREVWVGITETRLTGFMIHAMVLMSLGLLPALSLIPMPVVSGIFLYLGRKVMSGNGFLNRIKQLAADQTLLSPSSSVRKLGYGPNLRYTSVQVAMLSLLWTLKSFKSTSLFFPSVIGLLIIIRSLLLPKLFTKEQLDQLDSSVG